MDTFCHLGKSVWRLPSVSSSAPTANAVTVATAAQNAAGNTCMVQIKMMLPISPLGLD